MFIYNNAYIRYIYNIYIIHNIYIYLDVIIDIIYSIGTFIY